MACCRSAVSRPDLNFVVDPTENIALRLPVPFWAIDVSLSAGGQAFSAQWVSPDGCTDDAGRCLQQPVAQQAAQQIRAAGSAQVVSVETERVREGPPLLFDLGTLQEVCSKQLGLDVQETLEIAQALYETHKATTYPRSDSGYLPESMFAEVPTVLDSLLKTDPVAAPDHGPARPHPALARLERRQSDGAPRHHPDARTREPLGHEREGTGGVPADPGALPGPIFAASRVRSHRGGTSPAASRSLWPRESRSSPAAGAWCWPSRKPDEDGEATARSQALPALREGMACQVAEADIKALKTMPPKPYTQGELVKSMKGVARFVTDPRLKQKFKDTTGIGTEATRANIITGLLHAGLYREEGALHPRIGCGVHADRRRARGDCRPRHHRRLGTGAGHDRGGQLHPGCVHRQAGRLDFAVDRAVRQHVPVHQGSPRTGLSAVRRTHAPANRQERPVLVVQSLPRLQRHAAGGKPARPGAVPRVHAVPVAVAAKAPDRPRSP